MNNINLDNIKYWADSVGYWEKQIVLWCGRLNEEWSARRSQALDNAIDGLEHANHCLRKALR